MGGTSSRTTPTLTPQTPGISASSGTRVAGIVAARRGNTIGVAGICDACRIMPLRFDLSLGQEIEAIEYAVANGAKDVINMSFREPDVVGRRARGDQGGG